MTKKENKTAKIDLKEYITKSFISILEEESKSSLGDRSRYIGASDIGGCPFKVIKSKLEPQKESLKQNIIFQRGHLAEDMVAKMLHKVPFKRQVCLNGDYNGFPLKAHLDFLISSSSRQVIIEVKTVSEPLTEVYESWVLQVQFQMGLLLAQNKDEDIEVEAKIIAIDLNSGWLEVYNISFDDYIFEMCLTKTEHLVDCLQHGTKPKAIIQNYCNKCKFVMDCPKQGLFAKELPSNLKKSIIKINEHKKQAKEIKGLENELKDYLVNTGTIEAKLEDATQKIVVKCKESKSNRFDTTLFKAEHPKLAEKYNNESSSFRMTFAQGK